jgi:NADPH:quinone reductase-like Zn-dependent oxidoreductase
MIDAPRQEDRLDGIKQRRDDQHHSDDKNDRVHISFESVRASAKIGQPARGYNSETILKAAVVRNFNRAPAYADFADPVALDGEVVVDVTAAALSQLVRGQAAGRHYSSGSTLPLVPGVDGVGRLADGTRVYFAFPRSPFGAMAEHTVVKQSTCILLPADLDDTIAAGAANPGMSSWAALTERAEFQAGESVLINGATGASGKLAIQIAKHLGAKKVIATGRNAQTVATLPSLGADEVIPLDQPKDKLVDEFRRHIKGSGVNIILDYLWGSSAESIFAAVAGHGSTEGEPRVRFVQIGAISGQTVNLPAGVLRSSGLELMGSGLGSVSNEGLIRCIDALMHAIVPSKLTIDVDPVPLPDVEKAWESAEERRIVFTI